jgi:pyruvate formate lyase activating enzyme
VFFKGCNLRCLWCHNPEAVERKPEIQFFPERCIACGACVDACPEGAQLLDGDRRVYQRNLCRLCFTCTQECFAEGLMVSGREVDLPGLLAEIEKDRVYYDRSQGGVTFSGGEPLLQVEFLAQVLAVCQESGIHCAIDTAGAVAWSQFEKVLEDTDLFLYDIKGYDEETHCQSTGVGNGRILDNLVRLSATGKEVWVRIPVIPGVNDSLEEIERIADFLVPLTGVRWVELLPFHTLGAEKYPSLGRNYPMSGTIPPSQEKMNSLAAVFTDRDIPVRIKE